MSDRDQTSSTERHGTRIAPASQGIAHRIKAQRLACGLSQDELARRCEVTRQTVSNWERARTIPDALALGRIATACGTTANDLLGIEGKRTCDRALAARRELVAVAGIVLALQFITMLVNGTTMGLPVAQTEPAFAAFRFGVLLVGGLWIWHIARHEGLMTIRQMIDFASLASTRPGGLGDRLLRFVGRWFWTLWFALAAAMTALGTVIGMMHGTADVSGLIAPAFMLLVGTIPFTWERHARKRA